LADIESASDLWIEAGAMNGPPEQRHQIEFSDDVVRFFDQRSRKRQEAPILPPRGPAIDRPLRHRGESQAWGDIWRLGLPTMNMGGVEYPGKVLHFERRKDSKGDDYYVLDVAEPESARAKWWKRQAERDGATGTLPGPEGRNFGYWSAQSDKPETSG
jgi:hypothetical protein